MKFTTWLFYRLQENSTWRGLVSLATALGVITTPEQGEKIIAAGLAVLGAINVFRKAPASPDATPATATKL